MQVLWSFHSWLSSPFTYISKHLLYWVVSFGFCCKEHINFPPPSGRTLCCSLSEPCSSPPPWIWEGSRRKKAIWRTTLFKTFAKSAISIGQQCFQLLVQAQLKCKISCLFNSSFWGTSFWFFPSSFPNVSAKVQLPLLCPQTLKNSQAFAFLLNVGGMVWLEQSPLGIESVCICLWHLSCFSPNCLSICLHFCFFWKYFLFLMHNSDTHSHSVFVEHFQHLLGVSCYPIMFHSLCSSRSLSSGWRRQRRSRLTATKTDMVAQHEKRLSLPFWAKWAGQDQCQCMMWRCGAWHRSDWQSHH